MLNIIMLPPHVASPTWLSAARLDVRADVLPDPVRSLALPLGLVVALARVEVGAEGHVAQLDLGPEMNTVRIHSDLKKLS